MAQTDLIGTGGAASILSVSQRTVKRLAKSGQLPHALKMDGPTGAYLFRRRDVERLARKLEAKATA